MPDPRFIGLVHSILSSAEAALGEQESPMFHRLAGQGALARRTAEKALGLLAMLEEKTRGRLDETERATLHRAHRKVASLLAEAPERDASDPSPSGAASDAR